jgi:hypothetical protein
MNKMPRGDGAGPQGLGPGTGRGKGRKSTLGGTLFAFASMLVGNWLEKKLSRKKSEDKFQQDESSKNKETSTK